MTYYSTITKQVRHQNAMYAMHAAAPKNALTVPEHPIAYYLEDREGSLPTLVTYRWTPTGRVVKGSGHPPYDDLKIGRHMFWYHKATASLLPYGQLPNDYTPEEVARRQLQVRQPFVGASVKLPFEATKGDTIEASRRAYHRRMANALLRNMPPHAVLLPNVKHGTTAYSLDKDENGFRTVTLYRPTVDATKVPVGAPARPDLISTVTTRLYGTVAVGQQRYVLSQDGQRLVESSTAVQEQMFDTERLLFDQFRPVDAPLVPTELAWYQVISVTHAGSHVLFEYVTNGEPDSVAKPIKNGVVAFRGKEFKVDEHGVLTKA